MTAIAFAIDHAVAARYEVDQEKRRHLGASVIGDPCGRKLWYGFRWVGEPDFDGRTLRLFNRGHLEEHRFIEYLRTIGFQVWQEHSLTGQRFGFLDIDGHFAGESDGIGQFHISVEDLEVVEGTVAVAIESAMRVVRDKPVLLEFKTHNDKSFCDLEKEGVKKSKPLHWVQMNTYCGYLGLDRALYLAVNKNTDAIYDEIVTFDQTLFDRTRERANLIIKAKSPPPRVSRNPTWYQCKWCGYNAVCHYNAPPTKSCRSCHYSRPISNGRWHCDLLEIIIPKETEAVGCAEYVTFKPGD